MPVISCGRSKLSKTFGMVDVRTKMLVVNFENILKCKIQEMCDHVVPSWDLLPNPCLSSTLPLWWYAPLEFVDSSLPSSDFPRLWNCQLLHGTVLTRTLDWQIRRKLTSNHQVTMDIKLKELLSHFPWINTEISCEIHQIDLVWPAFLYWPWSVSLSQDAAPRSRSQQTHL